MCRGFGMGFKNHSALLIILIVLTIACVPSINEPAESFVPTPDIDATLDASMNAFMEGVTKLELSTDAPKDSVQTETIKPSPEVIIQEVPVEVIKMVETVKEITMPTALPYPTYTPYPTYAPYPTYTPVPTLSPESLFVEEPGCLPRPDLENLLLAVAGDDSKSVFVDLPLRKQGTVSIDGVKAEEGTVITAYYDPPFMPTIENPDGYLAGHTTVDAQGRYEISMYTFGTEDQHNQQMWRTLFFKIDNCYARESTWKSIGRGFPGVFNLTGQASNEYDRPVLANRIIINNYPMNSNYYVSEDTYWDIKSDVSPINGDYGSGTTVELTASKNFDSWGFWKRMKFEWTGVDKVWGADNEFASVTTNASGNSFITVTAYDPDAN